MNTNKTVTIRYQKYQMYQIASTGFVFVRSKKTGRTYSVAQIRDGQIVKLSPEPALHDVDNSELAEAWLTQ